MTESLDALRTLADSVRAEVDKAIVGQDELIDHLLIALMSEGHVLLEGPPGTAKTFLAQCFARATGLDFVTAVSGAATAIANVGPGLGDIIGPAGNFSTLNDTAKWILIVGMLVGRLELLVVFVVFTSRFWRA